MAIEKLIFPKPVRPNPVNEDAQMSELLTDLYHLSVRLKPGNYDYGISGTAGIRYELSVLLNGTGIFRMIPTRPGEGTFKRYATSEDEAFEFHPGGMQRQLIKEGDYVLLNKSKRRGFVDELIYYIDETRTDLPEKTQHQLSLDNNH